MGVASKYQDENGTHVSENMKALKRNGNGLLNSFRVVNGLAPTPADDMISIGLLLIYLSDKLPY
jgi:hypothetical protein